MGDLDPDITAVRPIVPKSRPGVPPAMPYIDINPHKARPKWQAYTVLVVLLALTAAVVGAALTRV